MMGAVATCAIRYLWLNFENLSTELIILTWWATTSVIVTFIYEYIVKKTKDYDSRI